MDLDYRQVRRPTHKIRVRCASKRCFTRFYMGKLALLGLIIILHMAKVIIRDPSRPEQLKKVDLVTLAKEEKTEAAERHLP